MAQMRQEHTRLIIDRVGNHAPAGELQCQGLGEQPALDLEQLLGERQKLGLGQTAIAVLDRLQEGVGDAGTGPHYRRLWDAEFLRDLVGRDEADAADVAGKAIGVLLDQRDRIGPIGLEDAHRPRCADAVALQEHHDLADRLLLGPAGGDALEPRLADAVDLEQALRRALDHIEHALAERLDQPIGEVGADALDEPGAEIAADALDR